MEELEDGKFNGYDLFESVVGTNLVDGAGLIRCITYNPPEHNTHSSANKAVSCG